MTFDEWLSEIENYGTRQERFYEEWDNGMSDARMIEWLKSAYTMGLEEGKTNNPIDHAASIMSDKGYKVGRLEDIPIDDYDSKYG
jgi:hypothetical protein